MKYTIRKSRIRRGWYIASPYSLMCYTSTFARAVEVIDIVGPSILRNYRPGTPPPVGVLRAMQFLAHHLPYKEP
jgi:hypothetical protein